MRLIISAFVFAALSLAGMTAAAQTQYLPDCRAYKPGSVDQALCLHQRAESQRDSFWWQEMDRRDREQHSAGGG